MRREPPADVVAVEPEPRRTPLAVRHTRVWSRVWSIGRDEHPRRAGSRGDGTKKTEPPEASNARPSYQRGPPSFSTKRGKSVSSSLDVRGEPFRSRKHDTSTPMNPGAKRDQSLL
jgi:hypothetical protein